MGFQRYRPVVGALVFALVQLGSLEHWACGQDDRTTAGGAAGRTRVVRRPESRIRYEEQERTVYRREVKTDYQERQRTVYVPVTRQQVVTRCVGRWNPFVAPRMVQYSVPCTRYEPRSETIKVPITRVELVPEKQTVKAPVLERKMVEVQVADNRPARAPASAVASNNSGGGAKRDPFAEITPTAKRIPRAPAGGLYGQPDSPLRYGLRFTPSPYNVNTASRKWH